MPSFCRHNRLIQNCPICSREQQVELRPIVSSGAPRAAAPRSATPSPGRPVSAGGRRSGGRADLRVRRLARGVDDGYLSPLLPGLRSSSDAERLASEVALGATRLRVLEQAPPGLYAEVAAGSDPEERTWLAFLISYLCPLDADDPFEAIASVRTPWAAAPQTHLDAVPTGRRSAHDMRRGTRTLEAYRAWAARAGSQSAAFTGDAAWTPGRRFERVYERLAFAGFHRDARFDLLVTLGRLGVYELEAGSLRLGGPDQVTLAAKRALGIGDPLLLERRAADLAAACQVPIAALDLGLYNWGTGERVTLGLGPAAEPDPEILDRTRAALGV